MSWLRMPWPFKRPKHSTGSWSVCSTVAEPPALLSAFACHYLDQGAEKVHLYLDDPNEEAIETLRKIDGVTYTACDARYWSNLRVDRPGNQVLRQIKNANQGYRECRTDWFLFCDADEFAVAETSFAQLLSAVDPDNQHVRLRVAERAFPADRPQRDIFDGVFRREINKPALLKSIYGDLASMTTRGILGHTLGKSFVRSGNSRLQIRIHFPVPSSAKEEARLKAQGALQPGPWLDNAWLAHFDGMTPFHWKLKLLRYYLVHAPLLDKKDEGVFKRRTLARSNQLNAVYQSRGNATELDRLTSLIRPSPQIIKQLEEADGLVKLTLDPATATTKRLHSSYDFSAEAFDAALYRRHHAVIEEYGLS